MFKRRGMLLITLSVVMGLGAAWTANNWVRLRLMGEGEAAVPENMVVVAALDIAYDIGAHFVA